MNGWKQEIFSLFVVHHILNTYWHNNLFKGRNSAIRILTLCIDCLMLISVLAQMYSGIVMSRYVFNFLPFNGGIALVRRRYILGTYWGFIFMNLHLGLHCNMIMGMPWKNSLIKQHSKVYSIFYSQSEY